MAKCPICGEPHKACGGPTTVAPADIRVTSNKGAIVTELKLYNVQVNGRRGGVPTVLQLNAEDAKARGLTDKDLFTKSKAAKASTPAAPKAAAKARAPRAKRAATPKNKQTAPAADKGAPASTPAPAAE